MSVIRNATRGARTASVRRPIVACALLLFTFAPLSAQTTPFEAHAAAGTGLDNPGTLEARARALLNRPDEYDRAADLLIEAAKMRGEYNVEAIENLRMAARLTYYRGDRMRAQSIMTRAAEAAVAIGDVAAAAEALLDVASIASQRGEADITRRAVERARLLLASPFLDEITRGSLRLRITPGAERFIASPDDHGAGGDGASGSPRVWFPAISGTDGEERSGTLRSRPIHLATGVSLDVVEQGDPSGEPVVFLHGLSDSWFSWSPVLARLPADVRAIVPSLRGHGDSDRPTCCYGMNDFTADVIALLDALGIQQATIVGHSMGSFIAQRVAADHASRVDRLVLVGSGATPRVPDVAELAEYMQTLQDPVPVEFITEFQASTAAIPLPATFMDSVIGESRKLPANVWRRAIAGMLESDAELAQITAPTLIISGGNDTFWGREQREALAKAIAGSKLIVQGKAGHAPHWEEPDVFVGHLRGFLQAK